jgi:hypothetical protein
LEKINEVKSFLKKLIQNVEIEINKLNILDNINVTNPTYTDRIFIDIDSIFKDTINDLKLILKYINEGAEEKQIAKVFLNIDKRHAIFADYMRNESDVSIKNKLREFLTLYTTLLDFLEEHRITLNQYYSLYFEDEQKKKQKTINKKNIIFYPLLVTVLGSLIFFYYQEIFHPNHLSNKQELEIDIQKKEKVLKLGNEIKQSISLILNHSDNKFDNLNLIINNTKGLLTLTKKFLSNSYRKEDIDNALIQEKYNKDLFSDFKKNNLVITEEIKKLKENLELYNINKPINYLTDLKKFTELIDSIQYKSFTQNFLPMLKVVEKDLINNINEGKMINIDEKKILILIEKSIKKTEESLSDAIKLNSELKLIGKKLYKEIN